MGLIAAIMSRSAAGGTLLVGKMANLDSIGIGIKGAWRLGKGKGMGRVRLMRGRRMGI